MRQRKHFFKPHLLANSATPAWIKNLPPPNNYLRYEMSDVDFSSPADIHDKDKGLREIRAGSFPKTAPTALK